MIYTAQAKYYDLKTLKWSEIEIPISKELQYDYSHCEWVSIDGEFTGIYPQRDNDVLWTIASESKNGQLRVEMLYTYQNDADLSKLIYILDSPIEKLFWYGVLDIAFLIKRTGIKLKQPIFDVKISSKLIRTYTVDHDIDILLKNLYDAPSDITDKKNYKTFKEFGVPIEKWPNSLHQYNLNDVAYLKPIADKLKEMAAFMGKNSILESMHKALPEISYLQLNGFYRDIFHPFYNDTDMHSAPLIYTKMYSNRIK